MGKQARKAEIGANEDNFSVYQPKVCIWLGVIIAIGFTALFVWADSVTAGPPEWWGWLFFSLIVLVYLLLAVYCIYWQLKIEGEQLHYKTLFRKTKTLFFSDISKVKIKYSKMY